VQVFTPAIGKTLGIAGIAQNPESLLDLYRHAANNELRAFAQLLQKNPKKRSLKEMYAMARTADFSHDVLGPSPERLGVWAAPPCGWSDLGTPERILRVQPRAEALAAKAAASRGQPRRHEAGPQRAS
jgi:hypothetical protein